VCCSTAPRPWRLRDSRPYKTCTASDFVFLSHAVVTRVLVSLEPAEKRRLGFRHLESASATSEEETSIAGQEASNG